MIYDIAYKAYKLDIYEFSSIEQIDASSIDEAYRIKRNELKERFGSNYSFVIDYIKSSP